MSDTSNNTFIILGSRGGALVASHSSHRQPQAGEVKTPAGEDAFVADLIAASREHGKHLLRLAALSRRLAVALGLTAAEVADAELGGKLHDIGKLRTPPHILNKPSKLDEDENVIMRSHAREGIVVADALELRPAVLHAILYHHERFDGAGYPDGLAGTAIPLNARLVCVADTYDTIITDRRYQARRNVAVARAELERCAGTQFDPDIALVFLRMLSERRTVRLEGDEAA